MSFERCPYASDCLGANSVSIQSDNNNASTNTNNTFVEGCVYGTTGPLCSLCIDGYNRNVGECTPCDDSTVPVRIGILVGLALLLLLIVGYCRRRILPKWSHYRPLWRDFLRVLSINITFAQINSSLPTVLEVPWPQAWRKFLQNFAFVNIDVMSLIGMNCITDYNFYVSFIMMLCLPVGILLLAVINFHYAKIAMKYRLKALTDKDKTHIEEQALHSLFHLADSDNSGEVDPAELASILSALGWKVSVQTCHELVEMIIKKPNDHGLFLLNEEQFLASVLTGSMKKMLQELDSKIKSMATTTTKTAATKAAAAKRLNEKALSNPNELIKWTLQKNIAANSLSGATQLLMLAHSKFSLPFLLLYKL